MINFRTGTHNPYTLYAGPGDGEPRNPFEVPIGFICDERAALLAAEAMTASGCPACPWGCGSCSLNRATCECYEHQDRIDEDGRPVEGSTPVASPARLCGMHYSWPSVGIVASGSLGPCVLVGAHERHRDEHGNEWRSGLPAAMVNPELTIASARCAHCRAAVAVDEMFSVMDGCRHRLCSRCLDQDHDCAPAFAAPAGEPPVALPPAAAALLTLREQLAAWRSADQDGYDPGALAEAAEVLLDGLDAAPAGEVVSVPPPAPARADEPAPVPPPVDALLTLDQLRFAIADPGAFTPRRLDDPLDGDESDYESVSNWSARAVKIVIDNAIEVARAAGVTDGRRQATEERTENLTSTLDDVLRCFYEKGHPGFAAVRSCWVREDQLAGWRLVLDEARSHG